MNTVIENKPRLTTSAMIYPPWWLLLIRHEAVRKPSPA